VRSKAPLVSHLLPRNILIRSCHRVTFDAGEAVSSMWWFLGELHRAGLRQTMVEQ